MCRLLATQGCWQEICSSYTEGMYSRLGLCWPAADGHSGRGTPSGTHLEDQVNQQLLHSNDNYTLNSE